MPRLKLVGEKWLSATLETEPDEPFEWDGLPTNSFLVGMSSKFDQVKNSCFFIIIIIIAIIIDQIKKDRNFVFYTTRCLKI